MDYIYIMSGSPRSPKLSKTQKLRNLTSALAIVEERTAKRTARKKDPSGGEIQ